MLDDGLHTSFLRQVQIPRDIDNVFESEPGEFEEMMMIYSCAIKEAKTKLQFLIDELSIRHKRNPI